MNSNTLMLEKIVKFPNLTGFKKSKIKKKFKSKYPLVLPKWEACDYNENIIFAIAD